MANIRVIRDPTSGSVLLYVREPHAAIHVVHIHKNVSVHMIPSVHHCVDLAYIATSGAIDYVTDARISNWPSIFEGEAKEVEGYILANYPVLYEASFRQSSVPAAFLTAAAEYECSTEENAWQRLYEYWQRGVAQKNEVASLLCDTLYDELLSLIDAGNFHFLTAAGLQQISLTGVAPGHFGVTTAELAAIKPQYTSQGVSGTLMYEAIEYVLARVTVTV